MDGSVPCQNSTTSMIALYCRFVAALIYLGLTLNVENLYGDMYANFAISAGVEAIAYTISIPSIAFIGRKKYNCIVMLVAGLALFGMILINLYGDESKFSYIFTLP